MLDWTKITATLHKDEITYMYHCQWSLWLRRGVFTVRY